MVGLRITLAARVTFYKRPNQQPMLLTLFSRRPSQSLSWEVVDGEGMVQTANRTLRLRTASAAASANLKRLVRVRLYPARTMFCSGVTDIDMCHHFLVWNDVLQHLRKRPVEAVLTAPG